MDELTDKWTDGWTDRHTQPLALKKEAQLSIIIAFRIRDHENGEKRTKKKKKKNPALLIGSFFSILVPFDPFHLYQLAKSKICTAPTLTPCFYQFPFLPLPRAPGRYGIFFLDLDLGSSLKVEREIKS